MTLDQLALRRMEEHRPLVPRVFQGAGQFVHIGHDPEAALCVRVLEWISPFACNIRQRRCTAGRQLQQGFGRFPRQVVSQLQQ